MTSQGGVQVELFPKKNLTSLTNHINPNSNFDPNPNLYIFWGSNYHRDTGMKEG